MVELPGDHGLLRTGSVESLCRPEVDRDVRGEQVWGQMLLGGNHSSKAAGLARLISRRSPGIGVYNALPPARPSLGCCPSGSFVNRVQRDAVIRRVCLGAWVQPTWNRPRGGCMLFDHQPSRERAATGECVSHKI